MHGESDFTDISPKPDEREDSKESSGGLRDTLIAQCEQEYENMINAVRRFSATEQYLCNQLLTRADTFSNIDYYCTGINATGGSNYR